MEPNNRGVNSLAPISSRIIVRIQQFPALFGISRSKLYEMLNPRSPRFCPTFPEPIRLSASPRGAVGFWRDEVEAWCESRRVTATASPPSASGTPR